MRFPVTGSFVDLLAAEWLRWQLVPAYALTGLLVVIWLTRATVARHLVPWRNHRVVTGAVVGLGAFATVVAVALPIAFPVFRFPQPTGPYAIRTLTYHWIDPARLEVFGTHLQGRQGPRELMVQIWYPAATDPTARRSPYLQDADAVTSAFSQIHHKPAFVFGHLKDITTNAVASADMADAQSQYPVLLFLEGVTGFRHMNTYQVEELVSHGYIVAAIDQPGAAADVVYPDGRQVTAQHVDHPGRRWHAARTANRRRMVRG